MRDKAALEHNMTLTRQLVHGTSRVIAVTHSPMDTRISLELYNCCALGFRENLNSLLSIAVSVILPLEVFYSYRDISGIFCCLVFPMTLIMTLVTLIAS